MKYKVLKVGLAKGQVKAVKVYNKFMEKKFVGKNKVFQLVNIDSHHAFYFLPQYVNSKCLKLCKCTWKQYL